MRTLWSKEIMALLQIIAAILMLMYFAAPATADMIVFGWMSPEGAYEFTNDINRVPVAHLHNVQRVEIDGIVGYRYYTHDDSPYTPRELNEQDEALVEEALETAEEIEEVVEPRRRDKRHRSDR
jgi:hypothetical protein